MKIIVFILFTLALCRPCCLSQPLNLATNGEMENPDTCVFPICNTPTPYWGLKGWEECWNSLGGMGGSLYMNTCHIQTPCGPALNPLTATTGHKVPHSGEGLIYTSLISYVGAGPTVGGYEIRGFAANCLKQPLVGGQAYHAGIFVSPTFGSYTENHCWPQNYVSDDIGIYFTDTFPNVTPNGGPVWFHMSPQVNNPDGNLFTDTTAWYEVSGYFVAQGGEDRAAIGNFKPDSLTTTLLYSTNSHPLCNPYSFITCYLDDFWVTAVPTETQAHDTLLCGTLTLHAQPGYAAYCWSTGDSAQSLAVSQSGTHYVRQYGQGFSSLRVDTFHLSFPSVLDAGASERWLCPGADTLTLAATPGFASYLWNTGATTPSISVTQPGTYAVRASDSCSVQHDTVWVRSRDTLTLALGPDPYLCPGGTLTLSAQAGFASYLWDTGAVTPALTVSQPGAHWLQTTDACGTERDSVVVHDADTLSLDLGADRLVCGQPSTTLHAPPGYLSYLWGDGTSAPSLTVFQSGTYTLSATDGCGTDRDSVLVTFQPVPPPPAVRDTSYCKGAASVSLQAQGTGLLWYATASATQGSPTAPLPPTAQPGLRLWYVSQTVGGCESERAAVAVRVLALPRFGQAPVPRFCEGETLLLCATAQDAESYRWLHGGTENRSAVGAESTYALVAENRCGADTLTFLLLSDPDCGFQVWIPSAFSPNGDGENDFFRAVSPASFSWFSLRVYDRWGVPLWEGGALGDAWDGTAKGLPVPEGAYAFVLECTHAASGRTYRRAGTVTVLR